MSSTDAISVGKIHHFVVNVRDLDVSLAFYSGALGLQHDGTTEVGGPVIGRLIRIPAESTARNAFLSAGGGMGRVELLEWSGTGEEEPEPERRQRNGARPGFALMSFLLREPALRTMYERLSADYVCWSEPLEFVVAGRTLHAFIVEDPDGNAIELFSLSD